MLVLLCKNGRTSVTDLARQLGLRQPTASSHLALLRGGRLVIRDRKSRHQLYYVNPATVRLDCRADGMTLQVGRVRGTRVTLEV
jgi:DNA-binding transcriptional ArsR family regulator